MPGVDVQLPRHRPVDDDKRRAQVRRRLNRVKVERLLAHRLDREHEKRKIARFASRHYSIRSEPQRSRLAVAWCDFRNRLMPGAVAVGKHVAHALRGRRHDRQSVTPAALANQLVHRVEIILGLDGRAGRPQ
ncbi:hypothetical protein D3C83_11280 [compost metagenome]